MKTEIFLYCWHNNQGDKNYEIEIRTSCEHGMIQTTRAKITEYQTGIIAGAKILLEEWKEFPGGYYYYIGPEPEKNKNDNCKTHQG